MSCVKYCIKSVLLLLWERGASISVLERRTQLIEELDVLSDFLVLAAQYMEVKKKKKQVHLEEPEEN